MNGEDDNQIVATTLQAMANSRTATVPHNEQIVRIHEVSLENRGTVQLIEKIDLSSISGDEEEGAVVYPATSTSTKKAVVAERKTSSNSEAVIVPAFPMAVKPPRKKRGPYKKKRKTDDDRDNLSSQEGPGTPTTIPRKKRGPYKKNKKGDTGIELFEDEDDDDDDDDLISKEDGLMFPLALYADYTKQAEQLKILKQTVAHLTATTQYWKAKAFDSSALDEGKSSPVLEPHNVIDLSPSFVAKGLVGKETADLLAIVSKKLPVKNRKQLQSELEQSYDEDTAKKAVNNGDFFYFVKQPDALYGRFGGRFKKGYRDLIQYKGKHGNCNVPKSSEDKELSRFVKFMRREFVKYTTIHEQAEANPGPIYGPTGIKVATSHNQPRMDAMNCIGFRWRISRSFLGEQWEANRQSVLAHYRIHKTFRINKRLDNSLHKWADNQRMGKKLLEKVGEEKAKGFTWARKAKLDEIGFPWTSGEDPMPEETFRKFISGNPLIYK